MATEILHFPALQELITLSRCSVRRLEKIGKFPNHIQLSPNRIGWRADEVTRWIKDRARTQARRGTVDGATK